MEFELFINLGGRDVVGVYGLSNTYDVQNEMEQLLVLNAKNKLTV